MEIVALLEELVNGLIEAEDDFYSNVNFQVKCNGSCIYFERNKVLH